MTINFNISPYYDDYEDERNFHRILFKPAVAVQARELTQLQTILQKQVERFGKHIFKEGAMVIPGQVSLDLEVAYVRMSGTIINASSIEDLIGDQLWGGTSDVVVRVVAVTSTAGPDPNTLIVKYTTSGGAGGAQKTLIPGETLYYDELRTTSIGTIENTSIGVGKSSIAQIEEGIYFVKGLFVRVPSQTLVLDKYSNTPTYRIGLVIDEQLITAVDDETLLDNAQGTFNFAAPGADRYKVVATLGKLPVDSVLDQDFIELMRVDTGVLLSQVRITEYSELERTLARRTYDESGDYTVIPFKLQQREYRNNDREGWGTGLLYLAGDIATFSGNSYVCVTDHTASANFSTDLSATRWVLDSNPPYNRGVNKVSEYPVGTAASFGANLLVMGLEPGKAYVRGYEIEKISTQFLTLPKARDVGVVDEDFISTQLGNYILITNLENDFNCAAYDTVSLYDRLTATRGIASGDLIGTARVRYIEFHSGTIGTTTAIYKLSLFDVQMVPGKTFDRDVKQLFKENGANDSTADVRYTDVLPQRGTITVSTNTVTGVGTAFQQQLKVGDYIVAASNTTPMRVSAITNDLLLTVDAGAVGIAGSSYGVVLAPFQEVNNEALVYPLPQQAIKSVSEVTIRALKRYSGAPSGGSLSIIETDVSINFESTNRNDYIAIDSITGEVAQNVNITINTPTQVTLSGLASGNTHFVYVKVVKTVAQKNKVVATATVNFTRAQAAATSLSLGKADVFKIDSVICNGQDIKDQYILDDGQRPTHYGISKLIRDSLYYPPGSDISVTFRYFTHSNTGDCFHANSYGIRYEDIPSFSYNGVSTRLSDVLDFRPRIADDGLTFTGTGGSLSALPVRDRLTNLDYEYYLPRHDKIALNSNGEFFIVQGVSALQPQAPVDPVNSMVLYKLEISPYTKRANDMLVRYIENKRYTMRDIGRLEKRIDNIEYYTALSLLEQETKTFSIIDSDGFDRFKAGFVVDNFSGHQVGDVTQPDYLCAIDMEQNILRPFFRLDNFNLNQTSNTNIRVTGDLATLNYTDVAFIEQPYASMTMNVNPYNVFTFRGTLTIHPTNDEWFEVEQLPDILINDNSLFDSLVRGWEQQGVLGTVWNSWQTVWTGTPVVTGTRRTTERQAQGWPIRDVTTTTFAQQVGESRSGVTTSFITRTEQRNLGNRVLYTSVIPFIRARPIAFVARGLKPNTRYYPFFDGTAISPYIIPATTFELTSNVGLTFDKESSAGSAADAIARRINNNPVVALNRGDVVIDSANTALTYGVVLHRDGNTLYVANQTNYPINFTNRAVSGSISGATGIISSGVIKNLGDSIITSDLGDAAGLFFLPNSSSIRFRTGIRDFKLTESVDNVDRGNSRASARYTASGILETRQQTIALVRTADLVTTDLVENRTSTTNSQQVEVGGWYDPLAQTFLVEEEGGVFITKVDLFFQSKDSSIPVLVEIREVVNGYPGKVVLPFSRVIKGAEEVITSEDGTAATTFTFQSPVYLERGGEYAIVIISDSDSYNVWIAQLGQLTVGEDRLISEQPYLGSLFKSQNASTWTADQTQDLKFKLYRASFSPLAGTMTFSNERLPIRRIDANPFLTTNTTATVKVTHLNHDLKNGGNVTYFGAQGFAGSNIELLTVNKTHIVSNVLIDSYTITPGNVAALSSVNGGDAVFASKNIAFDAIQPIVEFISFPQTALDFRVRTTDYSTWALDSSPSGVGVIANDTNFFSNPQIVLSADNDGDGANKSFQMTAFFVSTRENLSPVIDLNRLSIATVKNKINNPLKGDYALGGFNIGGPVDTRTIVASNTTIGFANSEIFTTNATVANLLATINPGREIRITNAANPTNNANVIVSSIDRSTGNVRVIVKDYTDRKSVV